MRLFFWLVFSFALAETKTVASFSRKINTCDPKDRPLQDGISKVVWSYSNTAPTNENTIQRHDERGVESVRFFSQTNNNTLPPDTQYFEVHGNNIHVTFDNPEQGPTTNYWCTAYKVELGAKKHIIKMEAIIDPRNVKQVHHMVVYQCQTPLNETELNYSQGCYIDNMPDNLKGCNGGVIVYVWAVGGTDFVFPDNVGLPIGPNTTYLLMEIHYDNPTQVNVIDSSGFRFYYIDPVREHEAGVFLTGLVVSPVFAIPPGQSAYVYDAWCPKECTSTMIPPTGINVISGFLHTHLAGISANLTVIRNGQALAPILNEPYYDFNYQDYTFFPQEFTIYPGDELYLTCTYNTQGRTAPTLMGLSTTDEMCQAFLSYYPRLPDNTLPICMYGNYSSVPGYPPPYNTAMVYCNSTLHESWNASAFTAYVPPVCNNSAPPVEATIPQSRDTLINPADYDKSQFLDTDEKYKLYWKVDREKMEFHAAIEVETDGWVGLGISEQGMQGADVIIAYSQDGEPVFKDRFATQKALPDVDAQQDYFNIAVGKVTPSESGLTYRQVAAIGAVVGATIVFTFLALVFYLRRRKRVQNNNYSDLLGGEEEEERPITTEKTEAVPMK